MIKKIISVLLLLILIGVVGFFVPGFFAGYLENETSVTVNRPRDEVWAKFRDESKMGDWLEGFKSIETIEEKPGVVGSRFKLKFDNEGQEIEMTETMTAFKEFEKFAFLLENDVMRSEIDVSLVAKGDKTEVIQKEKYRGGSVFWHSLFYWLKSSMAEHSNKNMENFKKYAEGAK